MIIRPGRRLFINRQYILDELHFLTLLGPLILIDTAHVYDTCVSHRLQVLNSLAAPRAPQTIGEYRHIFICGYTAYCFYVFRRDIDRSGDVALRILVRIADINDHRTGCFLCFLQFIVYIHLFSCSEQIPCNNSNYQRRDDIKTGRGVITGSAYEFQPQDVCDIPKDYENYDI